MPKERILRQEHHALAALAALGAAACGNVAMHKTADARDGADAPAAPMIDASQACGVPGLLAYYPLDADATDHAGHHDLATTDTTSVAGVRGQALAFNGTSSTAQVTGVGSVSGQRTLCAWISPQQAEGLGQPVFAGGSSGSGDFLSVQSSTPTGNCASASVEGEPFVDHWNTACDVGATLAAADAKWSLVCYAYDGAGTLTLSIDAVEVSLPANLYDWNWATLTIGSQGLGGTTTQAYYAGAIDEVTVWDHALDRAQLTALWGGGHGCVP